jgi:hypothetical protein
VVNPYDPKRCSKAWIRYLKQMGFKPMLDTDKTWITNDEGSRVFSHDLSKFEIGEEELLPENIANFLIGLGRQDQKNRVQRAWKDTGLLELFGREG